MSAELIPKEIKDKASLSMVAEIFSEATKIVRTLEEERKSISTPMNKALDELMSKTKIAKAPHESVILAAKESLSAWRKSPEVQEHYARLKYLERKLHTAQMEGDQKAIKLVGTHLNELASDFPKSLPVTDGSIRFRESLNITAVDESRLDDRYFIRIPDEKKILADLELMGAVNGVQHEYSYAPALYEDK